VCFEGGGEDDEAQMCDSFMTLVGIETRMRLDASAGENPAQTCTAEFGDGTPAVNVRVNGGLCQMSGVFCIPVASAHCEATHTYSATGTYLVKITAHYNGVSLSRERPLEVASLTGRWVRSEAEPAYGQPYPDRIDLVQEGQTVTGTATYEARAHSVKEGRVRGWGIAKSVYFELHLAWDSFRGFGYLEGFYATTSPPLVDFRPFPSGPRYQRE
jgi:hypothetical protein